MPSVLQRFRKWAEKMSKNDTLLAHFYIDKERRIFDPPSYFLFNIASADRCWQIIGTPGAGVRYRGRTSNVPVVNCWQVDKEFCKALRKYYQKQSEYSKYKYAVIFSKTKLQNQLEVVEVRPLGR